MAAHLQVIFSDLFTGTGVVCGGPYGFFVEHAQVDGVKPDVQMHIVPHCFSSETRQKIPRLGNLFYKKVKIIAGARDKVLSPGVTDKAA